MSDSLLDIISNLPGYKKQSSRTWCGPCPQCGGDDRFIVWIDEDQFSCRGCDFKGDIITWLRQVEGKTCGEAFLSIGRQCYTDTCEAHGKCVATRDGSISRPHSDKQRKLRTPENKDHPRSAWKPSPASTPAEIWQERARALVEETHLALLDCYEKPWNNSATPIPGTPAEYLADRGLPFGAVVKNSLGWLGKDLFKSRASWGLSAKKERRDGTETSTLWIPLGLVIPFFRNDGIHRIRIRRPAIKDGEMRYYWLEGSGDDTWMLNPDAKAQIVVETDLDGLMIDWYAGDIIGVMPLGSCSPRPKERAAAVLDRAVCILNALDFEPRTNEKTGRNEAPGGENWLRFWKPRYPHSKRHPAPGGKDAGEAFQNGLNIRAWIIAGLPAGLRPANLPTPPAQTTPENQPVAEQVGKSQLETGETIPVTAPAEESVPSRMIGAREIWFPRTPEAWRRLVRQAKLVIGPKETRLMAHGCPYELVEDLLTVKEIFPGAYLSGLEVQ